MTFLVARSQTAQLLGSHPQALWVATHGQQVALLWGFYPSAEMQSAYSTAPADWAFIKVNQKILHIIISNVLCLNYHIT